MANVRKQISDGKIIIECDEAEFTHIFSAIENEYTVVSNCGWVADYEITLYKNLRDVFFAWILSSDPGINEII